MFRPRQALSLLTALILALGTLFVFLPAATVQAGSHTAPNFQTIPPTITSDYPDYVAPGGNTSFNVTVNNPAGGAAYTNVRLYITFDGAAESDIVRFQNRDDKGKFYDLHLESSAGGSLVYYYGPNDKPGFEVPAPGAASNFVYLRITWGSGVSKPLNATFSLKDMDTDTTLASYSKPFYVGQPPALSASLPPSAGTGLDVEFPVSVVNPANGGNYSALSTTAVIANATAANFSLFQWLDGSEWQDAVLTQAGTSVVATLGPASFPAAPGQTITRMLKVQFADTRAYTFTFRLLDVSQSPELLLRSLTQIINVYSRPVLTVDLPDTMGIYAWTEFNFTLDNPLTGLAYSDIDLSFEIAGAAAGDALLQFSDGIGGWTDVTLLEQGGALVASLPAATVPLNLGASISQDARILFTQAGIYPVDIAYADAVETQAEWSQSELVVKPQLSGTIPDLLTMGEVDSFTVSVVNPENGSAYEHARFNIRIAGAAPADLSMSYWDGAAFLPLPLVADGPDLVSYFGPETGFPMPAGHDATTTFRVMAYELGSYDFSIELVNLHDATADVLDTLSGSLDVVDLPTVNVSLPDFFVAGELGDLSLHIVNPAIGMDYASTRYVLTLAGAELGDITSFQFQDGDGWHTVSFSEVTGGLQAIIYPGGKDLPSPFDEIYPLQIVFAKSGDYPFTLEIQNLAVNPAAVLTSTSDTAVVYARPVVNDQPFSLDENQPASSPVGTLVWSDADGDSTHTFSLDDTSLFAIDPATGAITAKGPFNFEGGDGPYTLTVTVSDEHDLADTAVVTITIADVNEGPVVANPLADQVAHTPNAFTYGVAANTFSDVDAGDSITFSAYLKGSSSLPAWLSFNPSTRIFSGTPGLIDLGMVEIEVRGTDEGGLYATTSFKLTVEQGMLFIYMPRISR